MAAAIQPNFNVFTYHDDDGTVWNKRGAQDPACNAIDGNAAFTSTAGTPIWDKNTRKFHVRTAVFQDPTTFRTKRCIVYTPAAFTAITTATTISVAVQGQAATVTYNLSEKSPEKKPVAKAPRQLADHP